MSEAIESGSGQPFAAEHFGPVFEGQVRRDDNAVAFVRGADDVEEKFGADFAGRHVAEFIEYQQIELCELSLQSKQNSFFTSFQ